MVGFKNKQTNKQTKKQKTKNKKKGRRRKNLTQNGEPHRYSWWTQKKKRTEAMQYHFELLEPKYNATAALRSPDFCDGRLYQGDECTEACKYRQFGPFEHLLFLFSELGKKILLTLMTVWECAQNVMFVCSPMGTLGLVPERYHRSWKGVTPPSVGAAVACEHGLCLPLAV